MEMKTKVLDKKHMVIISIIIISIIIGIFSATYAYFSDRKDKEILFGSTSNFGGGTLQKTSVVLSSDLSNENRLTNANDQNNLLSIKFDDVSEYAYYVSLIAEVDPNETTFLETEGSSLTYEVYHKTDNTLDTSSFTCSNNEYTNGETSDYCEIGTFEDNLDGTPLTMFSEYIINDTNTHYFDVYISNQELETKKIKVSFYFLYNTTVKPGEEYLNEPDISNGLVPVKYVTKEDGSSNWVITTKDDEEWYDYDNQKWANAVVLAEGVSTDAGTELTLPTGDSTDSDVLAMFVWIPRFSYTIGCTDSSTCLGYKIEGASDLATATPGAIDIKFIKKNTKDLLEVNNGEYPNYIYDANDIENRTPSNWYTHPAFTFGEDELSGIWVGKFETSVDTTSTCYSNLSSNSSSSSSNCVASNTTVMPRILPNVTSLRYQTINNQFNTAKKFTATDNIYGLTGDAHMMKNSEWAAVAYLSQSIYGKYGNQNYEGTNKEIYKNDSGSSWPGYTGRSQGLAPATSSYSEQGTYTYDDKATADSSYVANSGTGASTTGNIYGIYDMSGGAMEYVMGNYNNTPFSSEFANTWFTTEGNVKYYDKFTTTSPFSTKQKDTIGYLFVEVAGWYSDGTGTFDDGSPWVARGSYYSISSAAGAFCGSHNGGAASDYYSFRVCLATLP